jgi:chromosome segregation ATPase
MFIKLRHRSFNKEKKSPKDGGIFRKKARTGSKDESPVPNVEQVLTMTLSEDSTDTFGNDDHHISREQENIVSFTEQQVMENALRQMREVAELNDSKRQQAAKHATEINAREQQLADKQQQLAEMRQQAAAHKLQLTEKQQQVDDMKQELATKQHLFQELKRTHSLKMTAKQEEISKMKRVLQELKESYEQILTCKQEELESVKEISKQYLAEKESQLKEVKTELKDTKQELVKVSSVLIGCQHELHEQKQKSLFFWS